MESPCSDEVYLRISVAGGQQPLNPYFRAIWLTAVRNMMLDLMEHWSGQALILSSSCLYFPLWLTTALQNLRLWFPVLLPESLIPMMPVGGYRFLYFLLLLVLFFPSALLWRSYAGDSFQWNNFKLSTSSGKGGISSPQRHIDFCRFRWIWNNRTKSSGTWYNSGTSFHVHLHTLKQYFLIPLHIGRERVGWWLVARKG